MLAKTSPVYWKSRCLDVSVLVFLFVFFVCNLRRCTGNLDVTAPCTALDFLCFLFCIRTFAAFWVNTRRDAFLRNDTCCLCSPRTMSEYIPDPDALSMASADAGIAHIRACLQEKRAFTKEAKQCCDHCKKQETSASPLQACSRCRSVIPDCIPHDSAAHWQIRSSVRYSKILYAAN